MDLPEPGGPTSMGMGTGGGDFQDPLGLGLAAHLGQIGNGRAMGALVPASAVGRLRGWPGGRRRQAGSGRPECASNRSNAASRALSSAG